MPEDDALTPARFIRELWGIADPDWIGEFTLIQYRSTQDDPKATRVRCISRQVREILADWTSVAAELDHLNRTQVENIHQCVNPRFQRPKKRGRNDDVSHYVALWIDLDFHGNEASTRRQFEDTVKAFTDAGLPPSVVIESGHGLHAYWLLDKPYPSPDARPCCAGIQDAFKISDAINDPSRVLRMPGTINLKDPKNARLCRITEATYRRYPLEAFAEYKVAPSKSLEDLELEREKTEQASIRKTTSQTYSLDPKIEEAKKGVPASSGPYGGRHQAAVALAGHYSAKMKAKKYVLYAMREWNKLNGPPLPDDEVERAVDDIWAKEQIKRAEKPPNEKVEKKKAKPQLPWFDEDGRFNPAILAMHLAKENHFMATPIGKDGVGIDLYVYRSGAFRPDGAAFARSEISRLLGISLRDSWMVEVMKLLTEYSKVPYQETNIQASELVNVQNGMLDWRTGELKPHDPKYRSIAQIGAGWDQAAKCEPVERFFTTVLAPDEMPLVEEFMGYLLIPDTSFGKCLVAVGEGGNGKSSFLKLLERLIGPENISNCSLHQIAEERFTAAGLFGKLANFYDELESKALENTGIFKQIVTGDMIKAEDKGKSIFWFRPFCRLVFATNQMPRATDRSAAYFDRLLFVSFPNRIRDTSAEVRGYDSVLAREPGAMSYLLGRAVAGLRRLKTQGRFSASPTSREAIDEYQRECNSAYDFVQETCTLADPNGWIAKASLYDRYRAWSGDSGRKAMSAREFGRTLKGLNVREIRHGEARGWGGIAWVDGIPPTTVEDEVRHLRKEETEKRRGQLGLDF